MSTQAANEAPVSAESADSCCPPIFTATVTEDEARRAAHIFKALADPARVRLISAIANAGEEGICVCDLVEPVSLSQPTVSHHLRVLHDAGLVSRERRGTWVYYHLRRETLSVLSRALLC